MSAIAAAPLPPRTRGNNREKRPHSLRSIAAEISDVAGNITHLSSNITWLYQRVAEPGSSTFILRGEFAGATGTEI
jgi:hypothetical protein